jgi:hypothetical protein
MPKFEIWHRLNEWDAYHKIIDTPYYKSLYQPSNTYSNKGQKLKAPYLNLDKPYSRKRKMRNSNFPPYNSAKMYIL